MDSEWSDWKWQTSLAHLKVKVGDPEQNVKKRGFCLCIFSKGDHALHLYRIYRNLYGYLKPESLSNWLFSFPFSVLCCLIVACNIWVLFVEAWHYLQEEKTQYVSLGKETYYNPFRRAWSHFGFPRKQVFTCFCLSLAVSIYLSSIRQKCSILVDFSRFMLLGQQPKQY